MADGRIDEGAFERGPGSETDPRPQPSAPDGRTEELAELRRAVAANPLHQELSPRRLERSLAVVLRRLQSVTIVLENLWDPHNVSAVVRTAEGLGLDQVHVVEEPHRYRRHPSILHGADRWLEIVRQPDLATALAELRQRGFLTCAADLGPGCVELGELPCEQPVALVLGSEKDGLTQAAKTAADLRFTIPMSGFTGSFNVSVSAAIALWELTSRRRRFLGRAGDLDVEEMTERVYRWLRETRARKTPSR